MRVRGLLVAALAATSGLVAGCGTASAPSPPAGVDQLVIPTPSPDPDDFAADIDNPWFPLRAGTSWRYDVSDANGTHRMRTSVERGPVVAGVATTALVTREPGESHTDWFAQDERGNVWWFGRQGTWRAGTDGAQAGLAMPATPRAGDGWRAAYEPDVVEDTLHVETLEGSSDVPAGSYDGVLVLQRRTDLEPGVSSEQSYARGVGLVAQSVVSGSFRTLRLVRVDH